MKGSIEADTLGSKALEGYARLCGAVLARAHARSGMAPEISGYLGRKGKADRALVEFAPARCRQALDVLAMGGWMASANPLPLWRDGLDPIADRLRLAP